MHVNFTDAFLKTAQPPQRGTLTLWDTNLKHFGLRISSGGAKTFILLVGSGRRQSIGRFEPNVFGLGQARQKARLILAERTLGRYQAKSIPFDDAKKLYLANCKDRLKPRTLYDYTRLLKRHFKYGAKQLSEFIPQDIYRILDGIKRKQERAYAGVVIKAFFKWCVSRHYLDASPAASVPGRVAKKRVRVLSDQELRAIWQACDRGHNFLPSRFIAIVKILILTGLRRSECAAIRDEYVQDDTLVLPADLMKNHKELVLPLGALAKSILPLAKGFLFPGNGKSGHFNAWSKSKKALDELCVVSRWTLHDIRRSYRTRLSKLKVAPHIAEMLLGHTTRTPLQETYDCYEYLDEKRQAVDRYETFIREVVGLVSANTEEQGAMTYHDMCLINMN